jgi:hypothetical protein
MTTTSSMLDLGAMNTSRTRTATGSMTTSGSTATRSAPGSMPTPVTWEHRLDGLDANDAGAAPDAGAALRRAPCRSS